MKVVYLGVIGCVIYSAPDLEGFAGSIITTFERLLAG